MTMINGQFIWWHVVEGVAVAIPDSPAVGAAIDSGELRNVYGSIEGAIIYGGVQATAYRQRTEPTFDALHWLQTGEHKAAGFVTITKITAEARQ
jgi:hypothetical protein